MERSAEFYRGAVEALNRAQRDFTATVPELQADYIALLAAAEAREAGEVKAAESRLAEAERERDAYKAKCESLLDNLSDEVQEQLDRDAQQRRDGVLEGLGMALIILSASDDPEVSIKQAAQRLREGK